MITIKNPYPGFTNGSHRPFDLEDASFFFGRNQAVSLVKMRLRSSKFMAVVSQPKYGKTSFLRAGLMSDLSENGMFAQGGVHWNTMYCRLESDPLAELAKALAQPGVLSNGKIKPTLEEELRQRLVKSKHMLVNELEESEVVTSANLLMVFDDFGKALQDDIPEKEKNHFFQLLTALSKAKHLPVYVLISLDSMDLENQLTKDFTALHNLIRANRFVLPKLNQSELNAAIVNPAHKEGGGIEDSVVDYLIEELCHDEDQLRKLQLYMHRTWFEYLRTRKKGAKLNLQHLNRANGLKSKAKVKRRGVDEMLEDESEVRLDGGDDFNSSFLAMSRADQRKFQRIVAILMSFETLDPSNHLSAEQLMKASGADKTDYNRLRNKFLSLFHTDGGKVKIYKDAIPDEWKDWIYQEVEAAQALEKLVKYAIDHYINGRELYDIQTRQVLDELSPLTIFPQLTAEWAETYTEQAELALDLWEKLKSDVPKIKKLSIAKADEPKISVKTGAAAAKKISIGAKKTAPDPAPAALAKEEGLSEDEAIARLLAGDEQVHTEKPSPQPAVKKIKAKPKSKAEKTASKPAKPAEQPIAPEPEVERDAVDKDLEQSVVVDGAELDDIVADILADESSAQEAPKKIKAKPKLKIKASPKKKATEGTQEAQPVENESATPAPSKGRKKIVIKSK